MKNIEMHCHSVGSDGKNTPDEILQAAQRGKLDFLALTDHDVISHPDFQESLQSSGIGTCDSVEISARNYDHEKSLHLVSYAQVFAESLREVLSASLSGRQDMKNGQLQKVIAMGYEGSQGEFDTFMVEKLGRAAMTANKYDMSRYLLSYPGNKAKAKKILGSLCKSDDVVLHFYLECLKRGGELYEIFGYEVDDYEPSVEQTVYEVCEKSGGIVSMAHPNFTFEKGGIEEFQKVLPDYVAAGIRGIEINTMATHQWVNTILEASQKHDLIVTFGSDCHEIGVGDRKHGSIGEINTHITADLIEENFSKFKEVIYG